MNSLQFTVLEIIALEKFVREAENQIFYEGNDEDYHTWCHLHFKLKTYNMNLTDDEAYLLYGIIYDAWADENVGSIKFALSDLLHEITTVWNAAIY